jgi:hypothetical protein
MIWFFLTATIKLFFLFVCFFLLAYFRQLSRPEGLFLIFIVIHRSLFQSSEPLL